MKKRILECLVVSLLLLPTLVLGAEEKKEAESKPDTKKKVNAIQNLAPFNAISFSGVGNLHIKQSAKQNFTVEAEDSVFPLVIVYVKDKTLYIDLKNASDHTNAKLDYYLDIKKLQKIESFSSSKIFIPERFESDELNVSLNGLGEADIKIDVKKLIAKIDGGSKMDASGKSIEQEIEISGAGEFNGSKLLGAKATLNMNGSALAKTHVSDNLSIKISGEGEVKYCGKPIIVREISGKGVVSPLGEGDCRL